MHAYSSEGPNAERSPPSPPHPFRVAVPLIYRANRIINRKPYLFFLARTTNKSKTGRAGRYPTRLNLRLAPPRTIPPIFPLCARKFTATSTGRNNDQRMGIIFFATLANVDESVCDAGYNYEKKPFL